MTIEKLDGDKVAVSAEAMQTIVPQVVQAPIDWLTNHPEQTGVGAICAPGPIVDQVKRYLLRFEDADRGDVLYDNEQEARIAFANAEGRGWNCHLFEHASRAAPKVATVPSEPDARLVPLLRNAIGILGLRVSNPDVQTVINDVQSYIDGKYFTAGNPSKQWLDVAEVAAPSTAAEKASSLPERDLSVPAEQQGLFRKFDVRRVDGSDSHGGKHHGCEYFVLDVYHDQHAPAALLAYAEACKETHPSLSADLIARHATPAKKGQ